jgi:hypothetical protein
MSPGPQRINLLREVCTTVHYNSLERESTSWKLAARLPTYYYIIQLNDLIVIDRSILIKEIRNKQGRRDRGDGGGGGSPPSCSEKF